MLADSDTIFPRAFQSRSDRQSAAITSPASFLHTYRHAIKNRGGARCKLCEVMVAKTVSVRSAVLIIFLTRAHAQGYNLKVIVRPSVRLLSPRHLGT